MLRFRVFWFYFVHLLEKWLGCCLTNVCGTGGVFKHFNQ